MPSWQLKLNTIKSLSRILLPLLVLLLVLWLLVSFYISYQLMHPESLAEAVDPSSYLLAFREFSWNGKGNVNLKAWLIPAAPATPVIFLCHGYGSNRSHVLSLAERLYANGFSCVVLGFRGHGGDSRASSSLGWMETGDLLGARDELRRTKWLSSQKMGAWGVDMGAFVAMAAASQDDKFRALAIDSGFLSLGRYLDYHVALFSGGIRMPLSPVVRKVFAVMAGGNFMGDLPVLEVSRLRGLAMMMLVSEKEPGRKILYEELERQLPTSSVIHLTQTRIDDLSGPELKEYDNRVAGFFKSVNWQ